MRRVFRTSFGRATALSAAVGLSIGLAVAVPASAASGTVDSSSLAPLGTATTWLNGSVSPASLRGKVVLVDVFTIECINCVNVTPNLRALEKTKTSDGLAIVGVHTPETQYQHARSTVVSNLASLGVTWPVAIDNDYALWNDYHVNAWPTQLIFDRHGRLRKTVVGDSQDAEVNATIDALLKEPA